MIIYRRSARVLVQGITGKQGTFWAQKMMECGTQVVAGVNPKRAGEQHLGVPVYATAKAAMAESPFDVAVMFIPPAMAREAALDAIQAGARTVVILTEHIPTRDVMAIHHAAARHGTRIVGPNTAGIVTPGEGFVGIMPGHNPNIFQPGAIGVISRSGSLGTLICLNLTRAGLGQSAFLGIGGDPMIGTTTRDALQALDEDERTRAVVLVGEIGGAMEEAAADYAAGMSKPVVSFIAGRASPPGKKMGHAGAIVSGSFGSYEGKRRALEAAGVTVADTPAEIPGLLGLGENRPGSAAQALPA
ncbi:succinate--CoA ligase subunit alpha [Methylorubrum extorquens]|jgi:succinyl-CoA synthetase alpha subunit|uniref:succinate--CoA ligase subunit alpha n=1 Tax=Methylorubrum extorquens TaxID=408 RepID=UPI002238766C|nr:succinate--CoA ligase subunit alpha [Methylorubrum extorquens]UYW27523.1 succinate--CoA ligase subunit alpha [Methylorubrum extorquens]